MQDPPDLRSSGFDYPQDRSDVRSDANTAHNELRFNIDLQPGPIVGAHCPFLEPTLSQKVSPTAAKRHACTLLPIPLQSPIASSLCSQTSSHCSHWLCHLMTSPHSGQTFRHRSPVPSLTTWSTWQTCDPPCDPPAPFPPDIS